MKRLFIEPLDVLMFRSERSFIARESHVAKLGIISPLTFEGAIKSKILLEFCKRKGYPPSKFQVRKKRSETKYEAESLEELKKLAENDYELKELLEIIGYSPLNYPSKLNVLGVFFAEKEIELFPIPNDVMKEDKKDGNIIKIKPTKLTEHLFIVLPLEYSKVKEIDGLIEFEELKNYLWGKIPKVKTIKHKNAKLNKPYLKEARAGIQIERRMKTPVEGHLYTAEFLRILEKWGFIVWYESPKKIEEDLNGLLRLGGEGRGVVCSKIEDIDVSKKLNSLELIKEINEEKKFKLYLATPSYFSDYKPPEDKLRRYLNVNNLELVSALPGKPVYIGGYDFAMNKEKPLKRWVNAGAVYYYEFKGEVDPNLNLPIKIINGNIDVRCAFIGRW
jgi:CRISPR-associated protein Cmr3